MKKNMQENFAMLKERVEDALENTDLEYIRYELSQLAGPTILSGVGGSSVVSEMGKNILESKNHIITINSEPRDFLYHNIDNYKNVIACSYSGNNYGVKLSFANNLTKYLLSNNCLTDNNIKYLQYNTTIPKEKSFISLGATLIPIGILINYYLDGNNTIILDNIKETKYDFKPSSNIYEIFSGYDTSTASKYLESTIIESGIGIPIIHDKYSFCHGRSTLGINYDANIIYFNKNTEFDYMILEELKKYYKTIIIINSKYKDQILDDYQMLIQSMFLTKYIAEYQNKDLSGVDYSPLVEKVYLYNKSI